MAKKKFSAPVRRGLDYCLKVRVPKPETKT